MKYRITFASVSDAAGLIDYLNDVAGETDFLSFGQKEFFNSVEQEEAFIRDVTHAKKGVVLLARGETGDIIAGATCLSNERRSFHVFTMALTVKKRYWGRGIGTNLIKKLEDESKKLGCKKIMLHVNDNNEQAIKLYKKLGYELEGILKKDTKVNEEYIDTRIMSKFF